MHYARHATVLREAYLPDLERLRRTSPNDGDALALLGARLGEINRFADAADALEMAVKTGQREELVWRTWAASLAAAGQRPLALATLQQAKSGGADDSVPINAALQRLDALPADASDLDGARAISPDGPSTLTRVYTRGSYWNAVSDWQASRDPAHSGFTWREINAREHPDSAPALALWADALRRNGRFHDAEAAAQKALQLAPDSLDARLMYADVLRDGGAPVKAALQYQQLLAKRPDWLPALAGLGRAATAKKLTSIAIENLEKASRLDPNDPEIWIALGKVYFNQGLRYDRSLDAYRKAAALAPERTDYFTPMADTLRATYHFDEAEALLRKRLADSPHDPQAHYMLAYLLASQQRTPARTAEAEAHLRTSLEIEPDVPAVKQALAQLLLDKGDPDSAADAGILLSETLDAEPRNIGAMRLLAQAYRRIGKPDRAKEVQAAATELSRTSDQIRRLVERELSLPADISIHQQLAVLYRKIGDTDKAIQQEAMVTMLKTHPERAARGLKALMDATMREQADGAMNAGQR